jgi:hypothetical protein
MKTKLLMLMMIMALYSGCGSDNEKMMHKTFETNIQTNTTLQKSEKIRLYENDEVKVMLTATYLNGERSLAAEETGQKIGEEFVVGVYEADGTALGLASKEQNLTLEGKLPVKIKELSRNDPLLEHIPIVSIWSSFYLVSFPHTSKSMFDLIFENYQYGKGRLGFAKKAKFLLTHPAY